MAVGDPWALPVAFYFHVEFQNGPVTESIPFQSVTGLEMELDVDTWHEGGANELAYHLPKSVKAGRLTLRRAVLPRKPGETGASLVDWVAKVINGDRSERIQTSDVLVHLLDETGQTLHLWRCMNAYPVKWSTDKLDAQKNELAISELVLAYSMIKQEK